MHDATLRSATPFGLLLGTAGVCTFLVGCGDPLLSESSLESVYGLAPIPTEPAWELRWYAGPGAGLGVDCDAIDAGDVEDERLVGGALEVPPPEIEEPSFWIDEGAYRYAVATLLLVESLTHDPQEDVVLEEPLSIERGVWGGVENFALLFLDGDAGIARDELGIAADEDTLFDGFVEWVGFLPEVVAPTGSFNGALYFLTEDEEQQIFERGLPIIFSDLLSERSHEVLSGEAVGGAFTTEDCDE